MILAETIIFVVITNIFVYCDRHSYELIRNNQCLFLYQYSAYKIFSVFVNVSYPIFQKIVTSMCHSKYLGFIGYQ